MAKYIVAVHFSGKMDFYVDAEDFRDAEMQAKHLFMTSNISHNDIDVEDIEAIRNRDTQM